MKMRLSQFHTREAQCNGKRVQIVEGFCRPFGLALDDGGQLYIADFTLHAVIRFSPELEPSGWLGAGVGPGRTGRSWRPGWGLPVRSTRRGGFDKPHAIDFDRTGNLFVTEYAGRRIQKFDPDGRWLGFPGAHPKEKELALVGPATACLGADGRLSIADCGAHRILTYDRTGTVIGWLGAREGAGPTGGFTTQAGRSVASSLPGGFDRPHMARSDPAGKFLVADTWNHRMQKFSADGKFLGWIGAGEDGRLTDGWTRNGVAARSDRPGGFHAPVAFDFDSSGGFVVAEYGTSRLQRFGADGRFRGWFGGLRSGGVTAGWESSGEAQAGSEPGMFRHPYDVKSRAGSLYVADTENGRVQIVHLETGG